MANEAVIIELTGDTKGKPIRYTVADGVGISAGSLMFMREPKTALKSEAGTAGAAPPTDAYFAGIAVADKEANDSSTDLGLYTEGIFDLTLNAGAPAISAGTLVQISGANTITTVPDSTTQNSGLVLGKALEDSTDASSEVIQVLVGVR
jgi:hypothetical protein